MTSGKRVRTSILIPNILREGERRLKVKDGRDAFGWFAMGCVAGRVTMIVECILRSMGLSNRCQSVGLLPDFASECRRVVLSAKRVTSIFMWGRYFHDDL